MSCTTCNQIPICKPTPFKIEKTACPDYFTDAGDIITYIYTVTYDASYPVTKITLNDDKLGSQSVDINNAGFCSSASVLLYQQFVSNYTITEADVQAGQPITNEATATITFSDGSSIIVSSVSATITFGEAFVVGNMYSYFNPLDSTIAEINLDINNAGPSKAKGITVTLTYPEGITVDDIALITGTFVLGENSMTTYIDNIDPNFGLGYQFSMKIHSDITFYDWTGTIVTNTVNTNPDPSLHLLVQKIGSGPLPPICKPNQVSAEWQLTGPVLVTGTQLSTSLSQPQPTPQPNPLPQPMYKITFSMIDQPVGMEITSVTLVPPLPAKFPVEINNINPAVTTNMDFFFFIIVPRLKLTINYNYTTPIGTVSGSYSVNVFYDINVPNVTKAAFFCIP